MSPARTVVILAIATLSFATAACHAGRSAVVPSGRVVSESRPVPAFTSISVSIPGEVVLRQGAFAPVQVEADDNLLGLVETVVEEGSLKLRFKQSLSVDGRSVLRLTVTSPELNAIGIAGSGDVVSEALKTGDLAVSIAGSGDVKLGRLEAATLRLTLAGSGDFQAAGRAGEFTARTAGSGDIDASGLETRRATIAIAGSGDATVWATESLSASIVGSGDIRYRGDPALTRSVVGSGVIRRAGAGT